jgi:Arc/MetJ family transcription regulator
MRITIEIEDEKLQAVLKLTRQTKKSPAIAAAIDEYLERKRRDAFVKRLLAGQTDYVTGNDKIELLARFEDK